MKVKKQCIRHHCSVMRQVFFVAIQNLKGRKGNQRERRKGDKVTSGMKEKKKGI
jgi:hypothetical protein